MSVQKIIQNKSFSAALSALEVRPDDQKIFIITGKQSFKSNHAVFSALSEFLSPFEVKWFSEKNDNPTEELIEQAFTLVKDFSPNLILGIGGGSSIDLAKIIFSHLKNQKERGPRQLIAIPTTAGTGSESTQFATYYSNNKKQSLDLPSLLPGQCLLCPALLESMPDHVFCSTVLDAFSQGIESYWSTRSTDESRVFARQAIELLWKELKNYSGARSLEFLAKIQKGANLSGQAIQITRTTACHAISYPLTSFFSIPHGQAVFLTIPSMLKFNFQVDEKSCQDSRGLSFVQTRMRELYELLELETGFDQLESILKKLNFSSSLKHYGLRKEDIAKVVEHGFTKNRIANNPRHLEIQDMFDILKAIY